MRYFIIFFLFSILNGQSILPSLHSWFSAIELSMAGGGSLIMSPTSRINNPANLIFKKSFSTSLILYPAEIQAQSLAVTYPLEEKIIVVGINHISYGAFQGYDENAIPTNNYNSNDTWMKLGYTSKPGVKNINYGFSTQIYFSNLANYNYSSILFSGGFIWQIKKYNLNIGLSIEDMMFHFNSYNNISPMRYIFGIKKKLNYLPLEISIDYLFLNNNMNKDLFISGRFKINNKVNFYLGTSSRKNTQNTEISILNSILGSSGIGFNYGDDKILFGYGLYFYGTGGYINGIDLRFYF